MVRYTHVSLQPHQNLAILMFVAFWPTFLCAQDIGLVERGEADRLNRIAATESQEVISFLQQKIESIESNGGKYSAELVDPLMELGDTQANIGEFLAAFDSFERAVHIERTLNGLHTLTQRQLAYRIADVAKEIGDHQRAVSMHEIAYAIAYTNFANTPAVLEDSARLLSSYEDYGLHFHAGILSHRVMKIARNLPMATDQRINLYRAYAQNMRDVLFPPQREIGRARVVPSLPHFDRREIPDFHRFGRNSLRYAVKTLESEDQVDELELVAVLIDLADYYQITNNYPYSFPLYRRAWDLLTNYPALREQTFNQPKLLYIGIPTISDNARYDKTGIVELKLTVNKHGKAIKRRTVEVSPRDDLREYQVRIAARYARFRPAFADRNPIAYKNYPLIYEYPLKRRS